MGAPPSLRGGSQERVTESARTLSTATSRTLLGTSTTDMEKSEGKVQHFVTLLLSSNIYNMNHGGQCRHYVKKINCQKLVRHH